MYSARRKGGRSVSRGAHATSQPNTFVTEGPHCAKSAFRLATLAFPAQCGLFAFPALTEREAYQPFCTPSKESLQCSTQ